MVWLFGVSGKESLKALEKEVELLKQQLHGKINTGQTYLHKEEQARTDTKEKKKNEKENEDGKKKKKQTRMTSLNLLAELQKFNLNTDSLFSLVIKPPSFLFLSQRPSPVLLILAMKYHRMRWRCLKSQAEYCLRQKRKKILMWKREGHVTWLWTSMRNLMKWRYIREEPYTVSCL